MFALEYTPYIWPFASSLAILIGLGIYAYRQRQIPAATTFAWLMLALSVWTFCYIMELASITLEGKVFWAQAKYFGAAAGPIVWLILALQLTQHRDWLNKPIQLLLGVFVIVTIIVVFTNSYHHWFWTSLELVAGEPESQAEHGFYFWVYAGSSYFSILVSVILYFLYYRTTPTIYRRQALLLSLGGFIPLGGRILEDFFGIDIFPKVDNIILLFFFSGVLFALAIFRYGALNIVHIAYDLVIHNIPAGIIVVDMLERVIEMNPYARQLLNQPQTATGQTIQSILSDWTNEEVQAGSEREIALKDAGTEKWFQIQSSQIRADNGAPAGYAIVLLDITARKQAEHQLETLAQTDVLTGLFNRRYFYNLALKEIIRAQRYNSPLALLIFDIDHFKAVNDTYGHQAGDTVLKAVASACQESLRITDILARFGGEEFVVLLTGEAAPGAAQTAERLRQVVEALAIETEGQTLKVTISVGVANREVDFMPDLEVLLKQADMQLYLAKSNGRNQVSALGS
jgi:diguanylate cyclase (GGDEF)-like protein/PAS domain S-box-containing protein